MDGRHGHGNQQDKPRVADGNTNTRLEQRHADVHGIARDAINAGRDKFRGGPPRLRVLPRRDEQPHGANHEQHPDQP